MAGIIHPPKPAWSGPYEGGITQSLITRFLECPFRFYLYAYCGLEEPKPFDERLIWGDTLHKGLEHYVRGDSLESSQAAMLAYQNEKYPRSPATFQYTTRNMLALYPRHKLESWGKILTEQEIDQKINIGKANIHLYDNNCTVSIPKHYQPVRMRGKVDMLAQDLSRFGDHKGKGKNASDPNSVKAELSTDHQMNMYAYAFGCIEEWIYDLILIPEDQPRSPPQRVGETPEAWADRIFFTHKDITNGFPIKQQPARWINQVPHFQPKQDILDHINFTIKPIMMRICDWWEHVNQPNFDPNNPEYYNAIFYRSPVRLFDPAKTRSFKCNYHSYLTGQSDFSSLTPIKGFYTELSNDTPVA